MPLLVIRLTQPGQTVLLNRDPVGFHDVDLISFRGVGMTGGNPTLYLKMSNQHMIQPVGNNGARFPLLFGSDGCMTNFSAPMRFSGRHCFNDQTTLEFRVENVDGTPAVFSELVLVFQGHEKIFQTTLTEIDLINMAG